MTGRIKAIFFDLDGTLRIPTPGPTDAFIHFARSLQIDISPLAERRVKIWAHRYWGHEQWVKEDMARFDMDGFWVNYSKLLLEAVEATHDIMKRAQLVREWFNTDYKPQVELAPGSMEALAMFKQAGYVLGVISNRASLLHDDVRALGVENMLDLMLTAGEIGYWKPEPQIFAHAISQFTGLQAGECIYVGDNYYADARGAEAAGMIPVLYDPDDLYEKSSYCRVRHMEELQQWVLSLNGNGPLTYYGGGLPLNSQSNPGANLRASR